MSGKKKNGRHLGKRACAWLLALVTAVSPVCSTPAFAASEADEVLEDYREGVCERYEEYRDSLDGLSRLTVDKLYGCSDWAEQIRYLTTEVGYEIENADEKSFWEKFKEISDKMDHNFAAEFSTSVLWAGHALTDTELDKSAYVEYLSRIVSMHEKGFLETAESQAEYTVRVNLGTEIIEIAYASFGAAWDALPFQSTFKSAIKYDDCVDETVKKNVQKALDVMEATKTASDFDLALVKEALNVSDAYSLAVYSNLHKEKLQFLQSIYNRADPKENKKLRAAASTLMDAANLEFAGLVMMDAGERVESLAKIEGIAAQIPQIENCVDTLTSLSLSGAAKLATTIGGEGMAELSGALSFLGSNASLILAGFEIGGHIGRIFMGNDYEHCRELLIMDEIAGVLSDTVLECNESYSVARKRGETENCYAALTELAAAGEALCYVRLRGEYTACEYAKGKKGSLTDEELEQLYEKAAARLARCHTALNEVFPEKPAQVAVYADREYHKEICGTWPLTADIVTPEIYIEGNDEAAKKIMESQIIREAQEATRQTAEEMRETTKEASESGAAWGSGMAFADLCLVDAGVMQQGLSLRLSQSLYYAMAMHPNYVTICCNFDTSTGEALKLADILAEDENGKTSESRAALAEVLEQAFLANENAEVFLSWTNATAEKIVNQSFLNAEESLRERHWYLGRDGFHMVFDPYEIGPYAAGSPDIVAPWDSLGDIIKSEYQPESFEDAASEGVPVLVRKTEALEQVKVPEQDMHLYGTSERAFWVGYTEKTAYEVEIESGNRLLFYANYMTPNDVVCFNDIDDDNSKPTDGGIVRCLARPVAETEARRIVNAYGNATAN